MSDKMYKVSCSPECGFAVQSRAKDEVLTMVKEHGKKSHQLDMPVTEIEKMVKTISV